MMQLTHFNQQSGAALITSLIFLTILTILGMSSMGTALLESRMAGNARDRNMAFQAAEIGLRDAELYIRDSGRIVGLTDVAYDTTTTCLQATAKCDAQKCTYGFCYNGGTMQEDGDAWYGSGNAVWSEAMNFWPNAIQYQNGGSTTEKVIGWGVSGNGKDHMPVNAIYVLPSALPLVQRQPEYLIEGFQKSAAGMTRFYYRITARGYGMRTGTRVMLQEVYSPN